MTQQDTAAQRHVLVPALKQQLSVSLWCLQQRVSAIDMLTNSDPIKSEPSLLLGPIYCYTNYLLRVVQRSTIHTIIVCKHWPIMMIKWMLGRARSRMRSAAFQLMHVLKSVHDIWSAESDHVAAHWRVLEAVAKLAPMHSSNQTLDVKKPNSRCCTVLLYTYRILLPNLYTIRCVIYTTPPMYTVLTNTSLLQSLLDLKPYPLHRRQHFKSSTA